MAEGVLQSSPEGTPQGGPLSPLLANILLDDLDKKLERPGLPFVRYADDFMIFTKTRRAAERVFCAGEADETVREPRPVDSAASADVLLETLAVRPHAGPESLVARRSPPTGLPPRKESQRSVAHGQNRCQRGRGDERLAARSGTGVAEITLGQACSAPSNRVVQTRMLRGVGGGRSDLPAYPIRRFWVPYGAAFSNLALPRILRNTTNISLKSLCDLATGFMDFLDNRISSLDHSLPTRHGYEKTSAPQHWQPVQSPNVKGHRAATSDSPLRFCQISPLRGTLLFVVF